MTDKQYAGITNKTASSTFPEWLYYQPSMTTGTVYVWPVPNTSGTLKLITRTPLSAFASTADTVTLPPGWEEAIAYNLALRLAPEFEIEPSSGVVEVARLSKAGIKRANATTPLLDGQIAALVSRSSFNIFTGE